MHNAQLAKHLEEIATLLELSGESPFRIRAYLFAAQVVEGFEKNLDQFLDLKELESIPGIGAGIAEKILELNTTGHLKYLEELRKKFPTSLLKLREVPGLGPQKIRLLYEKLGIKNLGELEYACRENRLLGLKGFGKKTQEKILQGIRFARKNEGSYRLDVALKEGEEILKALLEIPHITQGSLAGSLRRSKEIIHDIDLVASTSKDPEAALQAFTELKTVDSLLGQGESKASVRLQSQIQVDLRIVKDEEYPFALHHFTGNKNHNTQLRILAKEKGLKLNEYGLFKKNRRIHCQNEREIYQQLGLDYIPPELREGLGEIDLAATGTLPILIEKKDLKGLFHFHSTWSDGKADIETMVRAAQKLGFEYAGISDHSQSAYYAGGMNLHQIIAQHEEIDRLNEKFKGIRILKGIESDILPDGSLDYPEKILKKFDFVIASIHSHFQMSEKEMTERLIRALENPYTTFLGHLTGRLLLAREPYTLDFERVFKAAAHHKKMIEINANPHRLDLDWRYLRQAKQAGVRFSIHPDAHTPEALADVFLGVGIARKGGLTPEDVFNTKNLAELADELPNLS